MTRKIVSLTTAFSFLLLIVSSVMLYIVPEGRIAYWAEWSVVFSKSQWGNLHITGGVLFIIFGLWHAILNFRAVINYCKAFYAAKKSSPVPLFASLGICLAVYAGTLWDVPPMRQLVSWNAEIKAHQAVKYGEPPFGHAEASSLRQFCAFLGMDIDTVLAAMQQAGFKGNPQSGSIFRDIAAANDMTPQQLYEFVLKATGQTARPAGRQMVPGGGKGAGRRFAGEA